MTKRDFRLEDEYRYNRSGLVRWIISHVLRYPLFPLYQSTNYQYSRGTP